MTGPSDDEERDGGRPDPLDALLRPTVEFLPAPAGSFERIYRTAKRRRRAKAAVGGGLAAVLVAGSLYLAGTFTPTGSTVVVTPPASSGLLAPAPSGTAPGASPSPVGPQPTPSANTGSAPVSPTGRPDPGVPGAGRSTGTSATATATPMCATSQLTASLGGGDAGAGNVYRYLLLTNHSGTTCHVTGFPGLSLLDAAGKQIGAPATEQALAHTPVVLRPGESASDTVHTANRQTNSSTECLPTSVQLRIYPPGNTASIVFSGKVTNCDNLFSVTPFTAGSTGNPPS
ncbi:DUF4232 domain-containing protein [Streptacidiphilus cavernicola]|uniref:DUF4232 domain-containing protein n=1 Tax=Streptacidiphilus cavernicola TaxID=3342716 RepID=A0ABV6W0M7_9ACTN